MKFKASISGMAQQRRDSLSRYFFESQRHLEMPIALEGIRQRLDPAQRLAIDPTLQKKAVTEHWNGKVTPVNDSR